MNIDQKKQWLPKIHQRELELLVELDRICKELNITYYICYGTLLGAVRHKGFIPWDDDADVVMLRSDYEKFMAEYSKVISTDKFYVDSLDNPNYYFPFSKLKYKNTLLVQSFNSTKKNNEIWIDIFPLDRRPSDKKRRKSQERRVSFYYRLLSWRIVPGKNKVRGFVKKTISFLVPMSNKLLKAKMVENCKKYNMDDSCHLVGNNFTPTYDFEKELLSHKKTYTFENVDLFGPVDYDEILTKFYGDYMTPPPEESRYLGHDIVEIRC